MLHSMLHSMCIESTLTAKLIRFARPQYRLTLVLITYDISTESKAGEKRLRKVAQICVNHGQRVQKSVFGCRLDDIMFADLVLQFKHMMHPKQDSIRIYRVHDFSGTNLVRLGRQLGVDFDAPMIL